MKEKGRFLKKYRGHECLNCGVPLDMIDRYCHNCGQINTTKKLSFRDFFDEFFASIFSYDSRLRHTIVTLLFNPGKISKDYIEGKRIRYANPFRFYLSVSIIFFIITGMLTDFGNLKYTPIQDIENNPDLDFSFGEAQDKVEEINETIPLDSLRNNINVTQSAIFKGIDSIKANKKLYYSEKDLKNESFLDNLYKRHALYKQYFKSTSIQNPNIALDSLKHHKSSYHKWIYEKSVQSTDVGGSIEGAVTYFLSKLPFIIFFMLPVFTLFIWLFYMRNNFTYMEHLVFIFHTQTMFFILLMLGILINRILTPYFPENPFVGLSILGFIIYFFFALKKFYNQGTFKTLVKFLILNQIFSILAVLGLTIGFLFSFALY